MLSRKALSTETFLYVTDFCSSYLWKQLSKPFVKAKALVLALLWSVLYLISLLDVMSVCSQAFSPWGRESLGQPHHNIPVLKRWLKKRPETLSSQSHMEKTRARGYQLHQEKFYVDIRKNFFTVRTSIHWNNLPRDVVRVLDNFILSDKRLTQVIFQVLGCSMILNILSGWNILILWYGNNTLKFVANFSAI